MGKTTTDLNLRAGTGLDYPVLAVLAEGTVFDILDEVGSNWLHIRVGEQEGYVYRSYVQMPRAGKTATAVAVRNTPGETLPSSRPCTKIHNCSSSAKRAAGMR